ncbi:MAG TPA: protoporphyrinogen oxidase, partial [Terracidiphilus sp.]|nr:protoporphyrinogen oxidase [Terracidiphilus sp.]
LIPTKLIPTALTRLFSLPTKIRMGLELLHPPRPSGLPDESVATLVERHYGREVVDRLADPLLSGIFGGDSAQLSARTVLPRLVEMEEEYGSLTRGMLAAHRKMREAMRSARAARHESRSGGAPAAPRSIFTAMRGGMNQMVDAVAARLDPASVRLSTPVSGLEKVPGGWKIVAGGKTEVYDAVIMASPAWAAGELLGRIDPQLAEELRGIPYSSSITVNLIYDESQLGRLPDGFGFLVPVIEGRSMLACTFVHRKFLGRTPPGKAVLRAFLGGMKNEVLMAAPDAELLATVRRELSEILGKKTLPPDAEPLHAQVTRWPRAMAQYAVGHQERMKRINASVAALPGLKLAGNAYDGIGIPDCIRLGRKAARELLAANS